MTMTAAVSQTVKVSLAIFILMKRHWTQKNTLRLRKLCANLGGNFLTFELI
jgi:hypothetical protein